MRLMTYEEYSKTEHPIPYLFKIEKDNKHLFYFGEAHSFDPTNLQWVKLKEFWQEFIKVTEGKKRIVFTEGGLRPVEENEEKAILEHGGMGLITFLASLENIEVFSPEPSDTFERNELLKSFSKDEVQYEYFARMVYQWGRMQEPKSDFIKYMTGFLEKEKKVSEWTDFDFSIDNMRIIHQKLFGKGFNENDTEFFYSIVDPVKETSVINKIARSSSNIRDIYIVGKIKEYWNEGYSVFIQYGCSHVVMQEPLLKEVL